MSDPKIAAKTPAVLQLEPGKHYWCRCSHSENQPFYNGAHQGTEFSPMELKLEEKKKLALCLCNKTGNAPFCDVAHKGL